MVNAIEAVMWKNRRTRMEYRQLIFNDCPNKFLQKMEDQQFGTYKSKFLSKIISMAQD